MIYNNSFSFKLKNLIDNNLLVFSMKNESIFLKEFSKKDFPVNCILESILDVGNFYSKTITKLFIFIINIESDLFDHLDQCEIEEKSENLIFKKEYVYNVIFNFIKNNEEFFFAFTKI